MTRGFTRIATPVARRRYTRVPPLNEDTLNFCRAIAPNPPSIVPIIPDPHAEPQRCFWNVRDKIELSAGEAVFGWAIFEFPGAYHEAQHHAVWRSPTGDLIDVTPPVYRGLTTGVFVEDTNAEIDWDAPFVLSHKRSGAPISEVRAYMAFHARIQRARFLVRNGDDPEADPGVFRLRRQEADAKEAMLLAIANGLEDGDPCFCGTDITFGDCCARHFSR